MLSYGDTLLRALLFWSVFLPLGERWSVDAVHRAREPRSSVSGAASVLILGQVVYMYFTNGVLKTDSELWRTGEAAVIVMGQDEVTYLLGDTLRSFPTALQIGGLLWFSLLLVSPMLLLLTGRKRAILATAFIAGHLSFALTVRIGTFPLVAVAALTLFMQPVVWNDAQHLLQKMRPTPKAAAAASRISGVRNRVAHLLPEPSSTIDEDTKSVIHRVALGLVIFGVVVLMVFSAVPLDSDDRVPVRDEVRGVADTLGMTQGSWSVFAGPETADRYYVFPAETTAGTTVDVFNSRELTLERPYAELQKQYGTYRERFYMDTLRLAAEHGNPVPAGYLAEYLCATWRGEDGESLSHVNMVMLSEDVTVDTVNTPGDRHTSASRFYVHGCGENEPKEILGL